MRHKSIVSALLLALAAGCSSSSSDNVPGPQAGDQSPATAQEETKKAETHKPPPPPPPPEETVAETGQKPAPKPKETGPVSPTPPPGMQLEKAQVGSGDKGRGYGQGIITTPVATYFAARERIMFDITIPDYIRAYKFEHDFKGPKSNEEFMEQVIKKNNIQLHTLPPGHSYMYDPKTEQLMVLKPG